jgi:type I restriction enzyme S subunit
MMPKNWISIPLGKISLVVTSGSRDWAKYYSPFGSKFIRMTNLDRHGINLLLNDLRYVSINSKSNDGKRTSLQYGDILISITAELGKIGWIPDDFGEAYINQHTAMIRIDSSKAESKFIAYQLSSYRLNKIINSLNDAGAKAGLNLPTVKSIPVLLPPLLEQKKIAKILTTWDKAIATTEQLITNSQQQKKALMQQLLTGKKRFSEFSDEWKGLTLGDISKITTGKSNRQDSHLTGQYTFFDRSEDIRTSDIYLFNCEAVIVPGESQDFIPKYFIGKFDLHQRTYAIIDFKSCDGKYIYYVICHSRLYFLSQAVGTTVKSLRLPMFQKMHLRVPSLKEQQKIANVLTTTDREIEILQQKLNCLKQEKKALMQQLLTGKRRVLT